MGEVPCPRTQQHMSGTEQDSNKNVILPASHDPVFVSIRFGFIVYSFGSVPLVTNKLHSRVSPPASHLLVIMSFDVFGLPATPGRIIV